MLRSPTHTAEPSSCFAGDLIASPVKSSLPPDLIDLICSPSKQDNQSSRLKKPIGKNYKRFRLKGYTGHYGMPATTYLTTKRSFMLPVFNQTIYSSSLIFSTSLLQRKMTSAKITHVGCSPYPAMTLSGCTHRAAQPGSQL